MYYRRQTLVHLMTRELARLTDQDVDSNWAWKLGDKTLFVNEKGEKFADDHKNYGAVYDWLDRPRGDEPAKGQHVAVHLRRYALATDVERAEMQEQYLHDWECDVLGEMKEVVDGESDRYDVLCPFADGSESLLFKRWFLERRGAIPLHKTMDNIYKKFNVNYCRQYVFKHEGLIWMYDGQMSDLKLMDVDHLKEVAKTLQNWVK